jgi:hypothetical protein
MSKLKKISCFSLAGVAALTVTSCGKYEDGPGLTLLTKKSRVAGSWDVKSIGSQVIATSGYSLNMNFEKNGSATFSYTYSGGNSAYIGSWDFASDKENLLINIDGSAQLYEIKRLTNKEMWLDDDISSIDGDIWKLEAK